MRGLQVLITVMTVAIFIGLGLLVYGFATKGAKLGMRPPTPAAIQELALPTGGKIERISPWREGLALHITAPKGEYIFLVNPSGTVATKLVIKHTADAAP